MSVCQGRLGGGASQQDEPEEGNKQAVSHGGALCGAWKWTLRTSLGLFYAELGVYVEMGSACGSAFFAMVFGGETGCGGLKVLGVTCDRVSIGEMAGRVGFVFINERRLDVGAADECDDEVGPRLGWGVVVGAVALRVVAWQCRGAGCWAGGG